MSEVDLKNAGRAIDKLRDDMREAALRGIWSAAARGLGIIQTQIIPARSPQPVDRGVYRAGWKWQPERDGATIYNNEPHAPIVEYGARAENIKIGSAMIRALAEWVQRKGIATDGDPVRVAWAIARAMQRRGIFNRGSKRGLGVLKEFVEEHQERLVTEEVERELRRATR